MSLQKSSYQVNIVFDVGANVGQFARNLRQIGYDGYICSFEPVTSAFADLSANFAHDRKWYGYPYALGSQATQQTFHVAEGATIMSSFLPSVENSWRQCPITVDVKRLDVLCAEVVVKCGLTLPRINRDELRDDASVAVICLPICTAPPNRC